MGGTVIKQKAASHDPIDLNDCSTPKLLGPIINYHMNRPLTDIFKGAHGPSPKNSQTPNNKQPTVKKGSGLITPGSRSGIIRPKSSLADNQKEPMTTSTGVTACQSNKNIQAQNKLSSKMSIGDIKQIISHSKTRLGSSSSKDKASRKKDLRDSDDRKDSKVKEDIKKSLANVINVYYPQQKHLQLDVSLTGLSEQDRAAKLTELSRQDFSFM